MKILFAFWNKVLALIPVMTSNTTPSGIASASSTETFPGSPYSPWSAFTNQINISAGWASTFNAGYPQWIQYQFPSAKLVTSYLISTLGDSTVYQWQFQGSNDGSSWTTLDTQNITGGSSFTWTFQTKISNINKYIYYRLYVTSVSGPSSPVAMAAYELQMYGH